MQQLQKTDISLSDEIIREREKEINKIKNDMQDVNAMFQELATLVNAQGEQIDNIASNIDTTQKHVDVAVDNIKDAEKEQETESTIIKWVAGGITAGVTVTLAVVGSIILL